MSYPLCQALEQWPHQILKGGRMLLCVNLVDPAPASAARGRGLAVVAALGLLIGHRPPPATRGGGAALAAAPSLLAGHGALCAARGRGPAVAVELRWTCGLKSSVGGQRQTSCSWRRCSQQPQCQQTQRFAGCA